jgi:hypothetical protein
VEDAAGFAVAHSWAHESILLHLNCCCFRKDQWSKTVLDSADGGSEALRIVGGAAGDLRLFVM